MKATRPINDTDRTIYCSTESGEVQLNKTIALAVHCKLAPSLEQQKKQNISLKVGFSAKPVVKNFVVNSLKKISASTKTLTKFRFRLKFLCLNYFC